MSVLNWKKIISIHKEIVKRGEDNFFSIPINGNLGFRSTCFKNQDYINPTGPWSINLDLFENSKYADTIKTKQFDQAFLGGPLIIKKNNNTNFANPVIYREVFLKIDKDNILLSPAQSKWLVSPPLVREILNNTFLDDFDDWLLEKIEFLNKNKFTSKNIIEVFLDDFPFLEERFEDLSEADDWSVFSPHSRISPFNIHLMNDYESMSDSLSKSKGGLSIFENKQKVKTGKIDLIPLVELNNEQEKSVKNFLSGNKLSVVTGPPGTGKSQVVLSALLNAWAAGKTVLFSSSNNTAVDVIKRRLDDFDSNTPLYVRAGSRERNNIQDALRSALMLCQEPQDININEIKKKEKELTLKIDQVKSLIESDKPKQITELYLSAEKAYSNYLRAKSKLLETENEILVREKNFFNEISLENEKIQEYFEQLKEWYEEFLLSEKRFKRSNESLEEKNHLFETNYKNLEKLLKKNNYTLRNIQDYEDINFSSPENFKKLNENLDNLLSEVLLEDDLTDLDNLKSNAEWDDIEDLNSALLILEQLKEEVSPLITNSRKILKEFSLSEKKFKDSLEKAKNYNLKDDVKTKLEILEEWQELWFEQSKNSNSFISKIPFSASYKKFKSLSSLEAIFNKDIPKKTWKSIQRPDGQIDRSLLSELVEVLEELSSNKNFLKENQKRKDRLNAEYELFLEELRRAKISTAKIEENSNWLDLKKCIENSLKEVKSSKKLYSKIQKTLEIQKKIRNSVNDILTLRMNNLLIKSWFTTDFGKDYEKSLNELRKLSNHSNANNFLNIYRKKAFIAFLDDWRQSSDAFSLLLDIDKERLSLNSNNEFEKIYDLFPSKSFIRPSLNGFHESDRMYSFIQESKKFVEDKDEFVNKTKKEIIGQSESEINRVLTQLTEAGSLLETESQEKINEIILKIGNTDYQEYPKKEISEAFDKFNEPMLQAKLESLNKELAAQSFEKAKYNWSKKISNDPNLQNAIGSLARKLNYRKGAIREESFSDFKKALKAIPIWISTAQSSQSIPMIPGLFDIVIIDEASQCTVTNALPLIYRGKSLAIIGDPEQLTSIPSVQREEENAIFEQFSYDNFPDNLRHFGNNIYASSFMNLYQASKNQTLLREHFRSHPLIIGFSNLNIYYKKYNKPLEIKNQDKYSGDSDGLSYIQVTGNCKKPSSGSGWINHKEAKKVVDVVNEIKAKNENRSLTIGIVTPFVKQKELIIDSLKEVGLAGIEVGTAHVYQGQEKDIMVFSTVISHGIEPSAASWISNPPNVLNVAMTRARRKLIIVGDMDYCENNYSGEILGRLGKYCKKIHRLNNISQEQKKLFELLILNGIEPEIEYPISDMHVDFFIPKKGQGLVIEVDGLQHEREKMQDESRDATLRSFNNKVLRFPTRDVRETPSIVIENILSELNKK